MARYACVSIIGVGLIGGSIGLALRRRRLAETVIGIGRRESTLATAVRLGAVDRTTTDVGEGVSGAQLVIVCTPVDSVVRIVRQVAAACPAHALITDVGSSKARIVNELEPLDRDPGQGPRFIGSHPLAGDHRTGPEHARAELFENHRVIVTPATRTVAADLEAVCQFWQALGAEVLTMDAARHDEAVGAISHLPHLVAAALARATPQESIPLAASGWKDTTRVAAADPHLWRQIFADNRQAVLDTLGRFEANLSEFRAALAACDDELLEQLLSEAKQNRDAVGN